MATYTNTASSGFQSGTATGVPKLDIAPTQSITGSPQTFSEGSNTGMSVSGRDTPDGETTNYLLQSSKPSIEPSQFATGTVYPFIQLTWEPISPTASPTDDLLTSSQYDLVSTKPSISPITQVGTFADIPVVVNAAVVPTAYFRRVEGMVYNKDGQTITNGIYLIALDNFAVAGTVDDDGSFEIYLLKQQYENFILVADAGTKSGQDKQYDYVWYEVAGNPEIPVGDSYVELEFDTATPKQGRPNVGLSLVSEVKFG